MQVSRQIGWSQESNLLYQILKQLNQLTSVIFGLKPKYKVYTALLTQSGGDDLNETDNIPLTIGVTYMIKQNSTLRGDFTNVGAPNNNDGTYFVATGTTPNEWGQDSVFYNTGAPVATVLENTIGNVWFTYDNVGVYSIFSSGLFTSGKTFTINGPLNNANTSAWQVFYEPASTNQLYFILVDINGNNINDIGDNFPIEIRVYS